MIRYSILALLYSLFLFAITIFVSHDAFAAKETESSLWLMSLSRLRLSNRLQTFVDIQPRTAIDSATERADGDIRQLLLRGALGYDLSDSLTMFQGYALITNYEPRQTEHRSFQEFLGRTPLFTYSITHRLRFEQRFLENVGGASLRGRYFMRMMKAITESLSFASNEEIFLNLNDRSGGPQSGFDQNRLFVGINQKVNNWLSLDIGYQNQYVERRGSAPDSINHILFLGFLSSFDLRE